MLEQEGLNKSYPPLFTEVALLFQGKSIKTKAIINTGTDWDYMSNRFLVNVGYPQGDNILPLIKYPDGSRNPYYSKPVLPLNLTNLVGKS